jgi:hypothetical protein
LMEGGGGLGVEGDGRGKGGGGLKLEKAVGTARRAGQSAGCFPAKNRESAKEAGRTGAGWWAKLKRFRAGNLPCTGGGDPPV